VKCCIAIEIYTKYPTFHIAIQQQQQQKAMLLLLLLLLLLYCNVKCGIFGGGVVVVVVVLQCEMWDIWCISLCYLVKMFARGSEPIDNMLHCV